MKRIKTSLALEPISTSSHIFAAPNTMANNRLLHKRASIEHSLSEVPLQADYAYELEDLSTPFSIPPLSPLMKTHSPVDCRVPDAPRDPSKKARQNHPLFISIHTWRWKLFTWALGTVCCGIIIVLLIRFDGQPLDNWKSNVQITTLVAAFAQFSQSALLVPTSYCIGQLKWKWFQNPHHEIDIDRFD